MLLARSADWVSQALSAIQALQKLSNHPYLLRNHARDSVIEGFEKHPNLGKQSKAAVKELEA